jgi:hypothetical protein
MARHITIVSVTYNQSTSDPDRRELQAKISAKTAVVYFESPSYLGGIDREGAEMARTACAHRAETIISADATGRCQGRNCPWSGPNSVALPNTMWRAGTFVCIIRMICGSRREAVLVGYGIVEMLREQRD